jgi:hypothetical protein
MNAASSRQSLTRSFKAFAALGVLAAVLLAVNANILVARWYKRWDLTATHLYTLSPATLDILRSLHEPIGVVVFLAKGDPLSVSTREMLTAYRANTGELAVTYVDPDQNPAEFQAYQSKLGILTGRAEDGRVVTDASIAVTRGERHWFITSEQIVSYDDDTGRARPRLEQALTEGIANLFQEGKETACFSTGHRETSLDDVSPEGLSELRHRLEKNNFTVETRDLAAMTVKLDDCTLLAIVGPDVEFDDAASRRVVDYVRQGGNALLLIPPALGEDKRVRRSGLDAVVALAGAQFAQDFVLETDAALRSPRGAGEVFFALPKSHAVTAGLERSGAKIDSRVLLNGAQSLRLLPGSVAVPLLVSSDKALALKDLGALLGDSDKSAELDDAPRQSFTLAIAAELPKLQGSAQAHGPRLVIAGASNLGWSRNYSDPALYGDRLFTENALSWLGSHPALVSVPEKPEHDVGLSLSEESLGGVLRYVLLYMPGSAALLGVFVLLRRRATEKQSRSDGAA